MQTFENSILILLAIIIIFIIYGSLYSFIFSIIQFIFSKGKQESKEIFFSSIKHIIVGIIMSILFLIIMPILFKKLQIPNYEIYTASNIFKKASNLLEFLKNFIKDDKNINSSLYNTL